MNKKTVLILLCLVTLLLVALSVLALLAGQQSSIGIIGGADGPTAIVVTGSPVGLYIITALFLIAATVWYLIYRSNNKR